MDALRSFAAKGAYFRQRDAERKRGGGGGAGGAGGGDGGGGAEPDAESDVFDEEDLDALIDEMDAAAAEGAL